MLTLMLLRHAKSDWSGSGTVDFERGLAPRGQRAAPEMGRYMAAHKLLPDLVLCSPALRALETWQLVSPQLKSKPKLVTDEVLYNFGDGGNLLKAVQRHGGKAESVLIVAHNPALEGLAQRLTSKGNQAMRAQLEKKFPTAALAVITFAASDWSEVSEGTGTLQRFVRPKDIMAEAGD